MINVIEELNTTKDFPTLAVLSVTSGRLLTQPKDAGEGNGIDQIYEVLEWMSDDLPFTHQLVRFIEECKPWIYRWHPEIIEADKWIENKLIERCETENVKACQAAMLAKFGKTITLQKIPQSYHDIKDPFDELVEMCKADNTEIVVVNNSLSL